MKAIWFKIFKIIKYKEFPMLLLSVLQIISIFISDFLSYYWLGNANAACLCVDQCHLSIGMRTCSVAVNMSSAIHTYMLMHKHVCVH